MFSEGEIEAKSAGVSARATSTSGASSQAGSPSFSAFHFPALVSDSIPASLRAPRLALSLLLAEAAAFALASASGKIPVFLFTAVRVLLTF
jgi:hypothetical protein